MSRQAPEAAAERLVAAAVQVREAGVPVRFEVLAGPPGETLRRFAVAQEMDLIVVERRGRGLSARVLGSVSADVVQAFFGAGAGLGTRYGRDPVRR